MTSRLFIFGMGYTASRLADHLRAQGWRVSGTGSGGNVAFEDQATVRAQLATTTHILSSVPPDAESGDPVLALYDDALKAALAHWIGYLSSTGVYGDVSGAWVDESAPLRGRRGGRNAADLAWQGLRDDVRVFRLPGIYGPERSALERVREGKAHLVDVPNQVFSRVHVDDIVSGICASFDRGSAGVYNLADDLPAPQNEVIRHACVLLGIAPPPLISLDDPALSPQARAFYAENRRVANGKAKRLLGWQPLYPDYHAGLEALSGDCP
jgi:nucleoside-diphosphate-sugar epimerase